MSSEVVVRPGRAEDCPEMLELIKKLADYEKMLDKVNITVDKLIEDGFGSGHPPYYYCFVAEHVSTKKLVGNLLYFYSYSTFIGKSIYMEDIFVDPDFRRKGVGKALLTALCKKADEEGCKRIDFVILDWNKLSKNFHGSFGACNMSEGEGWQVFRLDEDAIKKAALS